MSPDNEHRKAEIMKSVRERCTALADKFERLHHRVIKPVEQAGEAVSSTVDKMTKTVSTARHVVDSVGEQLAKWPWVSIAGGLAAGVGTGLLIDNSSNQPSSEPDFQPSLPKPGFLNEQIHKLTSLAAGAGLAALRDVMKHHLPSLAGVADQFTNDLSQKLGVVPFTTSTASYYESGI